MTKIDFYVLPSTDNQQRWLFACKLIEKAYRKNRRITVCVEDPQAFSQMLWSFKPEAFIPHGIIGDSDSEPVNLTNDQPGAHHDVLISLHPEVPAWFSQFDRVCEVVVQDPKILAATRSHFQFYRDRGYPLESHKMS